MINGVLSRGTGQKGHHEINVFGGGLINVSMTDIGGKNVAFVRQFLADEGYAAAAEDLGGTVARRVLFRPHSGRVFVKRLAAAEGDSVARQELAIAGRHQRPVVADIELF